MTTKFLSGARLAEERGRDSNFWVNFLCIRGGFGLELGMQIITDDRCAGYGQRGHPERPDRVTRTVAHLKAQTELALEWAGPGGALPEDVILRAHTPAVLARLAVPEAIDEDTPWFEGIEGYARASAAAAVTAMRAGRGGAEVFALMRPPGHHALRERSMGFCYLNNIAIAALEAAATGSQRIAVFDFDVHHGNGTEDILLNRPGVEFFSVQQFPGYPGTGGENAGHNCFNYPVAPGGLRETYRATLARALDDLRSYRPDLVAVSAGFDAYVKDPLSQGCLQVEDYHWLGAKLRALGVPMFSLLEGGYSRDLPELVQAYLLGVAGK